MATDQLPQIDRRQWYSIIGAMALVIAIGALGLLLTSSAGAAQVAVDGLSVADHEETIEGNVSDVSLGANLEYQHEVPDAERRIVTLEARQPGGEWTTLDYIQEPDPAGTDSGSVALSGSLVDAGVVTTDELQPALNESKATNLEVRATVELRRDGADDVTHQATDTATLTLTDGTTLEATIGGTGELTVETAD